MDIRCVNAYVLFLSHIYSILLIYIASRQCKRTKLVRFFMFHKYFRNNISVYLHHQFFFFNNILTLTKNLQILI